MFVSLQICWLVKPVINKVEYSKFLHVLSTCRKLPPYFLREKNSRKRLFITEYCLESVFRGTNEIEAAGLRSWSGRIYWKPQVEITEAAPWTCDSG